VMCCNWCDNNVYLRVLVFNAVSQQHNEARYVLARLSKGDVVFANPPQAGYTREARNLTTVALGKIVWSRQQ
jgi:hypothetical protein